jgi:hypothetical protein
MIVCSCKDTIKSDTSETTDTLESVSVEADRQHSNGTMCYMYTAGKNNADTFAAKLIINNNQVSGKMMYLYYEKDWRLGNITGTIKENNIDAIWTYMQEGMKDSVAVALKIEGDKLLQKEPAFDKSTGREYLPDTASYSQAYNKVDCNKFPKYDFDLGI